MNNLCSDEEEKPSSSINPYKAYLDEIVAGNTPINQSEFGEFTADVERFVREAKNTPIELRESVLEAFLEAKPGLSALYHGITPPPKQKTLINLRDLRNRPRPQWVIDGFIYENTIIELYAEAGCYKSFVAFDWASRIATGTPWLDRHAVNKKGTVIYIAAEGADGYSARADAWCKYNDFPFDTLAENFYFWPEPLPLSNKAEVSRFIEEVTDALKDDEQHPQFVVIDTLLRCADGQNINAPDVMGAIFLGADTIKRALHVPNVLIVHHAGKDQRLVLQL